jgi:hypothetical protein
MPVSNTGNLPFRIIGIGIFLQVLVRKKGSDLI